MKEVFNELLQNRNFLMFAFTVSYVLGLFAFFTGKPVLFSGIVTLLAIILILKEFPYKQILVWIAVFYLGFFSANYRIKNSDSISPLAPANAVITGQILSIPNSNNPKNTKFFFKVKKIKVENDSYENLDNKTLVTINSHSKNPDFSNLVIGNSYVIKGKLRKPFASTNPSQFSYENYLRNFKTYTTFYAYQNDVNKINAPLGLKWKIIQRLNNERMEILNTHAKYLKNPNIQVLGGIVFGDDAIAPPDYIKASFINSGLLHILAASGLNVGFISGFLLFFLYHLRVPYKIRIISAIGVVILYCLMTGLGASVVRAALMLIFVLLGKLIDRDAQSVALLSFVGLLMLIYNPAYINDVGFQLSFIVTLGILLMANVVLQYTKRLPEWLTGSIFIPIVAQLWVAPIQMFYFNTFSLYSVFANIITMPVLSVISCGGFVSSILAMVNPIADFVCKWSDLILNPLITILIKVSDYFGSLPHALVTTTHPSVIQILIYYVILGAVVYLLKTKFENKKVLLCTIIMSGLLALSAMVHIPNHNFEVIAFNVGNADAFLLKSPKNKYFIIDTGKIGYNGGKTQANIIILKYLKDRGIKNIEGLIITHFDSDHCGGAVDLINNLNVKKVYVNSLYNDKRLARQIYGAIDRKHILKVLAQNNAVIYKEPDFKITTYRAKIPEHGHDSEANENSVIALVQNDNTTMLFTGDSGVRAFNQIKRYLPHNITILKVGHHGAKNVIDKNMMRYLNPKISVVSVGYNRYGHPNPLTIKILSTSKVVRTDKTNAIKVISNGKDYEVDGYDSNTRKFYKKYSGKD